MGKKRDDLLEALEERDGDLEEEDDGNITGDEDDQDDDAGEDSEEGDEEEEEWTPPTKKQWDAYQAKLKRANKQAQNLREKYEPKGGRPNSSNRSRAQQSRRDEERREQEREAEKREEQLILRAVRGSAKAGLVERGADPELVDLAVAKLKASEVEFDDDDEPILDDWYEDMEERYPKLFKSEDTPAKRTTQKKRSAPSLDQGASSNGKPSKQKNFADQLIAASEGRRSRR